MTINASSSNFWLWVLWNPSPCTWGRHPNSLSSSLQFLRLARRNRNINPHLCFTLFHHSDQIKSRFSLNLLCIFPYNRCLFSLRLLVPSVRPRHCCPEMLRPWTTSTSWRLRWWGRLCENHKTRQKQRASRESCFLLCTRFLLHSPDVLQMFWVTTGHWNLVICHPHHLNTLEQVIAGKA